ncbi:LysR family transcriptional regulator (plasmid) [Sinorhizobium medicae]|uniref:LysR family transcriptional regulator n=1 Tax=Sinorhizobium medicae TaxID=110321 RepID=UPI002AF6B3B5|nr:LysR family transcriptional regulator [Sinorhizobium medicae]WQO62240.1 LysR family transcriptional regulator [Sinorhizobium medicae]
MKVEMRHIKAFHAVAESLSFKLGSEKLNTAQPAVSRTIKDLEEALRVTLFQRTTRSTLLTDAGRVFLKCTKGIVADLDRAIDLTRKTSHGVIGELRIGFNDFAINGSLPGVVRAFRNSFPMIEVHLVDSTTPESVEQVIDNRLDIAFVTGFYLRPELGHKLVRREHLICIVPADHRLAQRKMVQMSELKAEPFVMGRWETWKSYNRSIMSYCLEHGFTPNVIQQAEHIDGLVGFVGASMGICILPTGNWTSAMTGIVGLELVDPAPEVRTDLIWNIQRAGSQAIGNFIEVLDSHSRGGPASLTAT